MKVVNGWLGRHFGPLLATFLIATTCQAATIPYASDVYLVNPSYTSQTADSSSQSTTPAQGTPPTQPQVAPDTAPVAPGQTSTPPPPEPSDSSAPQQATPAPIVRQTRPAQATSPATQTSAPVQDQQFNKDQQFTTPAASQQLTPLVAGKPEILPTPAQPIPPGPPVGTALAPVINAKGTAGSRVAGAAVAPAKQRRIRTFAIRAALIVGAAVAIGVVAGASKASPAHAQ